MRVRLSANEEASGSTAANSYEQLGKSHRVGWDCGSVRGLSLLVTVALFAGVSCQKKNEDSPKNAPSATAGSVSAGQKDPQAQNQDVTKTEEQGSASSDVDGSTATVVADNVSSLSEALRVALKTLEGSQADSSAGAVEVRVLQVQNVPEKVAEAAAGQRLNEEATKNTEGAANVTSSVEVAQSESVQMVSELVSIKALPDQALFVQIPLDAEPTAVPASARGVGYISKENLEEAVVARADRENYVGVPEVGPGGKYRVVLVPKSEVVPLKILSPREMIQKIVDSVGSGPAVDPVAGGRGVGVVSKGGVGAAGKPAAKSKVGGPRG